MILPTVNVAIALHNFFGGEGVANARLKFELTGPDVDAGLVLSPPMYANVDATGHGLVGLWSNAAGTQGTQTRVTVYGTDGRVLFEGLATIPAEDCNLHEVLSLIPPDDVDDAQAAALAAQVYAASAKSYSAALLFTFDTATGAEDPGAGKLRANAATLPATTALYVDNSDRDGNPVGLFVAQLGTNWRVMLREGATGKVGHFRVTGPAVDAGGYRSLPVQFIEGEAGTFANGGILGLSYAQAAILTSAGSADTQVLYNDAGAVAGNAGLTFNKVTGQLAVAGALLLGGFASLTGEAANVLALKNGANPQTLRVYDTTDGLGNANFASLGISGVYAVLQTQKTGTGVARHLALRTPAATSIYFGPGGVDRWIFADTGHIQAIAPNAYDFASSANPARTGYFGTSVVSPRYDVYPAAVNNAFIGVDINAFGPAFFAAGTQGGAVHANGFVVPVGKAYTWSQLAAGSGGNWDLALYRDGAGILAQYNGANAQQYRIYNARTDASNGEWASMWWTGGGFHIVVEKNGTGVARPMIIGTNVAEHLQLRTNGTNRFTLHNTNGHLQPVLPNTYDFGQAGATVRTGYFGTSVQTPLVFSTAAVNLQLNAGAGASVHLQSGGVTKWALDGQSFAFRPIDDNAVDLASATARARSGYFGTSVLTPRVEGATITFGGAGLNSAVIGAAALGLTSAHFLGWAAGADANAGTWDTRLHRDGNSVLALRGSVAAGFNVYNSYVDAANNEFGLARWTTNVFEVGSDANGTGTLRNFRLRTRGGASILFAPGFGGGGDKWEMASTGHLAALGAYNITTTGTVTTTNLSVAGNPVIGTGATNPKLNFGSTGATALALRVTAAAADTLDVVRNDEGSYYKMRALTFEAVGGQIKFPAAQVASADVNTLDDYDEGNVAFTPTLLFGGTSVAMGYVVQQGRYTKVGNVIHFKLTIQLSAKGTSVGTATVGGFPFASAPGTGYATFSITTSNMAGVATQSNAYLADGGSVNATLAQGANVLTVLTDANFTNTSLLMISGHYFA